VETLDSSLFPAIKLYKEVKLSTPETRVVGHADITVTEVLAFNNYLVEDAKIIIGSTSCLQFMAWSLLDKIYSSGICLLHTN
jgi:hypothetical protein